MDLFPMNFQPQSYIFDLQSDMCLIDRYPYQLKAQPFGTPISILVSDFLTVFSQRVYLENGNLISENGVFPLNSDSVPLAESLCVLFGLQCFSVDHYLVFSKYECAFDAKAIHECLQNYTAKAGHLYRLYYFEDLNVLIPCHFYVPKSRASVAPMLVLLHGGGGTVEEHYRESQNQICAVAERTGLILFACDGVVRNSSYGCLTPPEGAPKNTDFFRETPQTLEGKKLSEKCIISEISYFQTVFSVDTKRTYLGGVSMGGMGSFYLASKHPELFAAIAPSSAAPAVELFDYAALAEVPIVYIAGTEDDHGFNHLDDAAKKMEELHLPLTYYPVQNGTHGHCWVDVLDQWIDFLLRHHK